MNKKHTCTSAWTSQDCDACNEEAMMDKYWSDREFEFDWSSPDPMESTKELMKQCQIAKEEHEKSHK